MTVCLVVAFFSTRFFHKQAEVSIVTASSTPKTKVIIPEELKTLTIKEHATTYDISLTLPRLLGSDAGALAANKSITQYFEKKSSDFKKEVATSKTERQTETRPADFPSRPSDYSSDASIVYEDKDLISYVVLEFFNFEGSAHPQHIFSTFVYDKKIGKLLTLRDVFSVSDAFYKKVSEIALKDLTAQIAKASEIDSKDVDTKWIKDGLSEKEKSFSNFTLSDKGVTFYFDEYIVASYAQGPQQSFLSFESLKEFKK